MNPHIINRNHAELKRLLAILFVMIGLADTISEALAANDRLARAMRGLADPATISRRLHRTILALLIPVESATRRLIIYMAAMLPTPVLTAAQLKGGAPSRRTPKSKHRIEHEVLAETDGHARFALTQSPPALDTS